VIVKKIKIKIKESSRFVLAQLRRKLIRPGALGKFLKTTMIVEYI